MYRIVFSNDAKKDLKELSKKSPQAVKKLSKLLEEIREHPRTGTGQVEPLKGYDGNVYSRRISYEHRLVYRIYDEVIVVLVLSAFGHYKKQSSQLEILSGLNHWTMERWQHSAGRKPETTDKVLRTVDAVSDVPEATICQPDKRVRYHLYASNLCHVLYDARS